MAHAAEDDLSTTYTDAEVDQLVMKGNELLDQLRTILQEIGSRMSALTEGGPGGCDGETA